MLRLKSGFMLADTMMGMAVMAIATSSLLLFFNSLQNLDKQTAANAAMSLNKLHNKIMTFDAVSSGDDTGASGISGSTNILSLFGGAFDIDKISIRRSFNGDFPTYSIDGGLRINFHAETFPCSRFLLYDVGYRYISTSGIAGSWVVKNNNYRRLDESTPFCDSLIRTGDTKNLYFKD